MTIRGCEEAVENLLSLADETSAMRLIQCEEKDYLMMLFKATIGFGDRISGYILSLLHVLCVLHGSIFSQVNLLCACRHRMYLMMTVKYPLLPSFP